MLLLPHIIVSYIKENIITRLQKLYSLPRNPRVGSKLPTLFVKKPLCTGDLSPVRKIFIERRGYRRAVKSTRTRKGYRTYCFHFTQITDKNLQFPFKNWQFSRLTRFLFHSGSSMDADFCISLDYVMSRMKWCFWF